MASIQQLDHLKIPLEDIKLATNNFSDSNFIGQGGFGRVYKGQFPISASTMPTARPTAVAVKRLDVKGGQGQKEFLMEIVMLSSYKHDNLVSLVGFSKEGDEKIIVYKHEVRGSLDKYLATDLTWVQRLQICLGAARGLNYLHDGVGEGHRVLHRDIKSSNILLDENWEAKVSDFGLSKIGPTNQAITFLVTTAESTNFHRPTMIYDVNSPLFRSFLSQKGGSSDKRKTEEQRPKEHKPKANENKPVMNE